MNLRRCESHPDNVKAERLSSTSFPPYVEPRSCYCITFCRKKQARESLLPYFVSLFYPWFLISTDNHFCKHGTAGAIQHAFPARLTPRTSLHIRDQTIPLIRFLPFLPTTKPDYYNNNNDLKPTQSKVPSKAPHHQPMHTNSKPPSLPQNPPRRPRPIVNKPWLRSSAMWLMNRAVSLAMRPRVFALEDCWCVQLLVLLYGFLGVCLCRSFYICLIL